MNLDLSYLATMLSSLCGIPIHIYTNKQISFFYSQLDFPCDPILPYESEILHCEKNIGFFTTQDFFYFGYINSEDKMLVLGPFRPVPPTRGILLDYSHKMGVKGEELESFINAMQNIVSMPLGSVMQSLSMVYYVLNGEKISVESLIVGEHTFDESIENTEIKEEKTPNPTSFEHNTYAIENDICRIVEHGDVNTLLNFFQNAPAVRAGSLSDDYIRQLKNTFIVTATLVSRAAIKGHMEIHEALSLSDIYIQKSENANSESEISSLQVEMILEFTKKVQRVKGLHDASPLLIQLNQYIFSHLSTPIKIPDVCSSLYVSKSHLFECIKKETGKTVGEYIIDTKIEEAKRYLRYTSKTLSTISYYLGFSTQSHFNRVFKEKTGLTPKEYRVKHKKT